MVDAHPRCGPTGAQKFAVDTAAVTVIERGFDSFTIVSINDRNLATGILMSPTMTRFQGSAAFSSGGFAGIARRYQNTIEVRMFRHGDAGSDNAIDARQHLGAEWREMVKNGVSC